MLKFLSTKCKQFNSFNHIIINHKIYFPSKSNKCYFSSSIKDVEKKNEEPIIQLTNDAINKMKEINLKYKNSKALKVCVEAGGCSGFQYSFSLIDKNKIKDKEQIVYDKDCIVVIDKQVIDILKNSKIHYINNLISKKFTIENIQNISSKCSCGNSFDIDFV
ncbi:putative iron-sulfur assembly protein [Plasmodium gaboni]|uniref:Putative iron-sulfur assembly protein n=1 Tax=Plasmodium gaboni TaxID=647221 RepID=A0A151LWF0_9APIC|nr:putative iron-sulfur assembly protein [Plasmodium gaboni]KYO03506.1 putative iron-sulfur assembly protein [Plasmodium gaboni]SOV20633.1 iron-sulfur assembly protein, putative [Plasmodium sp. DRC-Itaito]